MTAREDPSQEPMSFFPHDANSFQDVKCQRLVHRCGFEGYGRWWRLCEYMAATKGHKVPFQTEEDVSILAQTLGFDAGGAFMEDVAAEQCKGFVENLLDIGLLEGDGRGCLESRRMHQNAAYFGKQRTNARKGGRPKKKDSENAGQVK